MNHDPRRINLTATLAITEYCKPEKHKHFSLYTQHINKPLNDKYFIYFIH